MHTVLETMLFIILIMKVQTKSNIDELENSLHSLASKLCSGECSKNYTFTVPKPLSVNITTLTLEAEFKRVSDQVKCVYTRVTKYWSYDYQGTVLDSQGWSDTEIIKLSEEEIKIARDEDKCLIGTTCSPGDQCSGSLANSIYYEKTRTNKVPPQNFKHEGQKYLVFAYHTIVTDWRCEIQRIFLFPVISGEWGSPTIRVSHVDKKQREIESNPTFGVTEDKYHFVVEKPSIRESVGKVVCHKGENAIALCSVLKSTDPAIIGHVLELNLANCVATDGKVMGKIPHCWSYFKTDEYGTFFLESEDIEKVKTMASDSASLGDAKKLIDMILYSELKSLQNQAILQQEIYNLGKLVKILTTATMKTDQNFIHDLFGAPYLAKFVTSETFQLCPCTGPLRGNEANNKNCLGIYYFDGKNWIINSKNRKCVDGKIESTPIDLWTSEGWTLDQLSFPDLTGALSDHEDVFDSHMNKINWESVGKEKVVNRIMVDPFQGFKNWLSETLAGFTEIAAFLSLTISLYCLTTLVRFGRRPPGVQ